MDIPYNEHPDLASQYYATSDHDLSGGLPVNLDSLRDGPPGQKPFYPYSTLIRYAIKGSPNQRLLLEDIYYAIESRFPYFRTADKGWKNSVRHNLSLNPCFEKMPRPLTDRGKGSYWTVNDNIDPRTGVHRNRNKTVGTTAAAPTSPVRAKGKGKQQNASTELDELTDDPSHAGPSGSGPTPQPADVDFEAVVAAAQGLLSEENEHALRAVPVSSPPPFSFPFPDPSLIMSRCPPLFPGEPQPETDPASGQPNWRSLWLKELGHLQQLTQEQEKAGVEQEWYRIMIWRVRAALLPPINPDGSVMGLMIPPLPSHPSEAGPEEAPLNHRPLVEEKDDDTML